MTKQIPHPPRPPHEPWSARQRRAALRAGFLGLNVIDLGAMLVFAAVFSEQLADAFAFVAEVAASGSGFSEFAASDEPRLWLLRGGAAGVVIILAGLLTSVAILRAGGVRRPWVATWSAFGLSVPVLLIASTVVALVVSAAVIVVLFGYGLLLAASDQETVDGVVTVSLVVGIALTVVGVVMLGLIGSLIWWWMAHLFRERMPPDATLMSTTRSGAAS